MTTHPTPTAPLDGEWITWTGGENPVPGQRVDAKGSRFVRALYNEPSEGLRWDRVTAYRLAASPHTPAGTREEDVAPWAIEAERAAADEYAMYMGDPDGNDDTETARLAAARIIEIYATAALRPAQPTPLPDAGDGLLSDYMLDRLDALITPESPMHPIGCSTWEAEADVTVSMAKERLTEAARKIAELEGERDGWVRWADEKICEAQAAELAAKLAQDAAEARLAKAAAGLEPFAKLWDQIDEDDRVRRAWRVNVTTTSDAIRTARQTLADLKAGEGE